MLNFTLDSKKEVFLNYLSYLLAFFLVYLSLRFLLPFGSEPDFLFRVDNILYFEDSIYTRFFEFCSILDMSGMLVVI